ncbi:MAG: hypothetical protein IKF82_06285 [Bacilli bacterium]|nr:hypothetical protein [Bacilli bacterium]MBR3209857.1 hypothetical protein [Bacilli bacterium]
MINATEFFSIIFYILLIILVFTLIVLVINANKTLGKLDRLVDDITVKSNKLNGVFTIIDGATDAVVGFSDSIVSLCTNAIGKVMNRKKENEDE